MREEIKELLLKTNRKLSHKDMCQHLGGTCYHNTIKYFYETRSIPPKRRQSIYITFGVFWKGYTAIPTSKVRFVLHVVYMDNIFTFKTRRHDKILTFIGLDKNYVYARNKSKIYKEMGVLTNRMGQ